MSCVEMSKLIFVVFQLFSFEIRPREKIKDETEACRGKLTCREVIALRSNKTDGMTTGRTRQKTDRQRVHTYLLYFSCHQRLIALPSFIRG